MLTIRDRKNPREKKSKSSAPRYSPSAATTRWRSSRSSVRSIATPTLRIFPCNHSVSNVFTRLNLENKTSPLET
jgi:hypothetical protein